MLEIFIYAAQEDFEWLRTRDYHIDATILKRKIDAKEILVAKSNGKIIGWLRFGLFWDLIPFMNMLVIEEEYRNKGIGKKLVQCWEREMKKSNFTLVMTSSLSNENAQHFYRKLGYVDAGSLLLPKEPLEIIFTKAIE